MMQGSDIQSGLLKLITQIEQCPALTVYQKEVNFQDTLSSEIRDDVITQFFSTVNKFNFSYGWNNQFPVSKRKIIREKYQQHQLAIYSDNDNPLGAIHLLSKDSVFSKEDFFHYTDVDNRKIVFAAKEWLLYQLSQAIKPFDLYSDFAAAAFLLQQRKSPLVLLLTGHYDDWNNSLLSDFESYMRLIVATKGLIGSRMTAYDEANGHKLLPVVYDDLIRKVGEVDLNDFV